ncbi:MAG TPA: heparan-alpha-glucosaminide N-acetyltransferase domain-containing protein [Gemmatimonadaceae bacterium]|nr:heparan-alpha-glucosaminide N-acetyltransferase domain-containing protein [Gemmatimonadaceae bacterium]
MSSLATVDALPVPVAPRGARLLSLDVFRGLTIIGMLIVNNPGDASTAFLQARHSPWNGCTLADLVFPFFLFVVGITTQLSLRARAVRGDNDREIRGQILRRGALLFVIGLLLNWFPFYQYGAIDGHPHPTPLDHVIARLEELRLLGVLQRIGIAYAAAALLSWKTSARQVAFRAGAILVGYWLLMTVVPVPGEGTIGLSQLDNAGHTLSAWVDKVTLDWSRWGLGNHIWRESRVYDPEGLLSTLPAIATVLLGVLIDRLLAAVRPLEERIRQLLLAGAGLTVLGLLWGVAFPINKNLWTSSYVAFTAGIACITLGTITWLIDVRQWKGWTKPFVAFGINPITAYVGAELSAVLFDSTIKLRVAGRLQSLHQLTYDGLARWLPPAIASLGYSLLFVALWYFVLRALHRRGMIFKI